MSLKWNPPPLPVKITQKAVSSLFNKLKNPTVVALTLACCHKIKIFNQMNEIINLMLNNYSKINPIFNFSSKTQLNHTDKYRYCECYGTKTIQTMLDKSSANT